MKPAWRCGYRAGIARGEENPSLAFLVKLAAALKIHSAQLFG